MKRYFLISVGVLSFLLGSAGAILPLLPTTPFLLLAGYCFARSSNKFDVWLKRTKLYQIYASDYVETKSIPKYKKWKILISSYILMGISILFAPLQPVKVMLIVLALAITIVLVFVVPNREDNLETKE
ncbi:YbaN family protein [Carnobacterium jeotgali]|uniref:YbaN family protein n=1 Tax=Carnobacterium jeotgali TaxID=545534 RepID=UPI00388D1AA7